MRNEPKIRSSEILVPSATRLKMPSSQHVDKKETAGSGEENVTRGAIADYGPEENQTRSGSGTQLKLAIQNAFTSVTVV